ncbi:unnamed protein product [Rodentolepis nana]|uniref:Uncharacterized protein n=1 Tax=Rodentolepis nana TaxID=102285 RepID=A0A0R3TY44_RODNA|nr:unnamed protein product [Rodentolepis nana]
MNAVERVFLASRAFLMCWAKVATCWFVDLCGLKIVLASRASLGIFDVLEESVFVAESNYLLNTVGLKKPGQPPVNQSFHRFTPKNIAGLKEPGTRSEDIVVLSEPGETPVNHFFHKFSQHSCEGDRPIVVKVARALVLVILWQLSIG